MLALPFARDLCGEKERTLLFYLGHVHIQLGHRQVLNVTNCNIYELLLNIIYSTIGYENLRRELYNLY